MPTLAACGHSAEVEKRFAHEFRCNDVTVKAVSSSTFVASGCRQSATYTCAGNQYSSTCVREYTDSDIRRLSTPAVRVAQQPTPQAGPGRVERTFDEQRKLHVVKLNLKGYRGIDLTFVGAPEHELTTVYLTGKLRGKQQNCTSLRVRVNDEPFDAVEAKIDWIEKSWTTQASGRFEFEIFKPLARKYATFAVELCGQRVALGEGQMSNLIKFLEIFSQIAIDAQNEQRPKPAVTDDGVAL